MRRAGPASAVLGGAGHLQPLAGRHQRGGPAEGDLARERGTGEHGDGMPRRQLGEQLRHAQPTLGLHPLGGGDEDGAGLEVRHERRQRRPDELGGHRQHHQPASAEGVGGVAGGGAPRGQGEAGQIAPVLARLADLARERRVARPEPHGRPAPGEMDGERRPPAPRAQDGDGRRGAGRAHAALTRWPSRLSVPARSRWMFC